MGCPPSGGARGLDPGRRGRVGPPTAYTPAVTRDELIDQTRRLIAEGDRLAEAPSLDALRAWLQLSDETLAEAWGSMDRYHLAWLSVGKPKEIVRGRPMSEDEEAAYVREVARQKTAALRMSLDAVERQHMPFVGETGGPGLGDETEPTEPPIESVVDRAPDRSGLPADPTLTDRLAEARRDADAHRDHGERRAPRPDRMQR